MAPNPLPAEMLIARQYYNDYYYRNGYYSPWNSWGRWVFLVVAILFIVFVALMFSCINARRRRRNGLAPRYGTGWLGGKQGTYNTNYNQGPYQPPAPPYSPPNQQSQQYTGNTFNQNEGYYGQQTGIELQQPPNTYNPPRAAENVYSPPEGPPPGKGGYGNDGIIR